MKKFLLKFYELYIKDEDPRIYGRFDAFESFRSLGMSISDYVTELEWLYNKVNLIKIEVPETILAYLTLIL